MGFSAKEQGLNMAAGVGVGHRKREIKDDEVFLTASHIEKLGDRAEKSRELLGGLVLSLVKWIIASLLTINAGGMLALLNADNLDTGLTLIAEISFVIGLIAALICAFVSLYEIVRFLPDQGSILLLEPGVHKRAAIDKLTSGAPAKDGLRDPILWAGWLSVFFFVIGVAIAGKAMLERKPTSQPRHVEQVESQPKPSRPQSLAPGSKQ
jgi:hypothetical protein